MICAAGLIINFDTFFLFHIFSIKKNRYVSFLSMEWLVIMVLTKNYKN